MALLLGEVSLCSGQIHFICLLEFVAFKARCKQLWEVFEWNENVNGCGISVNAWKEPGWEFSQELVLVGSLFRESGLQVQQDVSCGRASLEQTETECLPEELRIWERKARKPFILKMQMPLFVTHEKRWPMGHDVALFCCELYKKNKWSRSLTSWSIKFWREKNMPHRPRKHGQLMNWILSSLQTDQWNFMGHLFPTNVIAQSYYIDLTSLTNIDPSRIFFFLRICFQAEGRRSKVEEQSRHLSDFFFILHVVQSQLH